MKETRRYNQQWETQLSLMNWESSVSLKSQCRPPLSSDSINQSSKLLEAPMAP